MNSVWILTVEYNEYDQYGEYFVAVFKDKPTAQMLMDWGVPQHRLRGVLDGKGRADSEDKWFILKEVPFNA
jgi:hypothetical protein